MLLRAASALARRRRRFVEAERARITHHQYMPEAGMEPKRLLLFFSLHIFLIT